MNLAQIRSACIKAQVSDWPLRGTGWSAFMCIRQAFKPGDVVSAEWLDYRRGNQKLWPAPNMWKESTYDRCVLWSYDVNTRILTVQMSDGDFDGYPTDTRCKWTFLVDEYAVGLIDTLLRPAAMSALGSAAWRAYEAKEEARVQAAVKKIVDSYLKD